MATADKKVIKHHATRLTPKADTKPVAVQVDDSARLRQIRQLVRDNNRSSLDEDLVICQIYMESRFDASANADGSTARGLMQLLRAPVRELYRIRSLQKSRAERESETEMYSEADQFHDSPGFVDESTNIQTGTEYLQYLIKRETQMHASDPVAEAYKDYRGRRNGIYYQKIKAAADRLRTNPESMQVLRDMVE
jgi:hypothetical protein